MNKNKMNVILDQNEIFPKSPTGVKGLDEITFGGLPKGRPTLICGNVGCGKTLLAMEFLVRGAKEFGEPGIFMSFEETEKDLVANVHSLGFDLRDLESKNMIHLDHVFLERTEISETGEFDLEGLFIRLNYAIDSIGAKRVVLDTIESLFEGLPNPLILRIELRRLFHWLKEKGVTTVITGESSDKNYTRQGLEEFVSDCVIVLDHRVTEQSSTRRMRIVKYRGSQHGTNEYPFLIDGTGFSVLPITSLSLNHVVSTERISSGIDRLDNMLGGEGYYKGSSVLISGTAGTGKSSIASKFTESICKRKEKVLYFSFEESPTQIIRNMRSIGIELEKWVDNGNLQFHSMRPTFSGLELHLTTMVKLINDFKPNVVIIDPLNSFVLGNNHLEAKMMLMRLIDYLKLHQITGFFTSLTVAGEPQEHTDVFISSLIDTWLLLRDIEIVGERNRGLYILKSRGMEHSNQIREFKLSKNGIELLDVYKGIDGVLTGSARLAQEAKDNAQRLYRQHEIEQKQFELENKRKLMEVKIKELKDEFEIEKAETLKIISFEQDISNTLENDSLRMTLNRRSD